MAGSYAHGKTPAAWSQRLNRLPTTEYPRHGACFNAHTGDIEDAPALAALHSFKTELQDSKLKVTAELDKTSTKDWGRQPNLPSIYPTTASHGVVIVGGGGGTMHAIESLREVCCDGCRGY
jgi:hypothetical protein